MPFAGFELSDGKKKGYAIAKCKYIDGIIELRNIGKELINAYRNSKEKEQNNTEYVYGESKFLFVLDKNMCEILNNRYFTKYEIPRMQNGFEIFDLKGFWTFGFMRNKEEIPYEVLEDLKKNNFEEAGVMNALYTEKMKENMPKVNDLFKDYFYVKVEYMDIPNSDRSYSYLSDDDTIKYGDIVLVNRAGREVIAFVVEAKYYKGYEVPFPVEKTKYIIKKIENKEELIKLGFSTKILDEYCDFEGFDEDEDYEEDDEEKTYYYYYIVTTLSDNREIIEQISKSLLEKRLVAGTQITIVTSSFWWNGKIESKEEYKLEVTTRNDKVYEVAKLIETMHNYKVPEISSTSISCLTDKMKEWIDNSLS